MDKLLYERKIYGKAVVEGTGRGEVVSSSTPLSFWGGYDAAEGRVIDRFHELNQVIVKDKILVLPEGRGSCTGSVVLLEAILSDNAPAGIVLRNADEIITLGGVVADEIFSRNIPVIIVDNDDDFQTLLDASHIEIAGNIIIAKK